MPLRDHFREPLSRRRSWEGPHGLWPSTILLELNRHLPDRYVAEPRVHLGNQFEIDISMLDEQPFDPAPPDDAAATFACPTPTLVAEAEPSEDYAYEVLVFDQQRERRLVAAVELISPGNQDRPASRRTFVDKCRRLLRCGVCVAMVDLVTTMSFNLYGELCQIEGHPQPGFDEHHPSTFASSSRMIPRGERMRFESWAYPLSIGAPLPTLPLWITPDTAIPLELEPGYEAACEALRIPTA